MNYGQRIASSSENYLLFGAIDEESSDVVLAFVKKLNEDFQYLENNVFEIDSRKVEFKVRALPNDMKMLSFLAGELSNSSTYFSTVADVSQVDGNDFNKWFDFSNPSYWKPWNHSKRLSDAAKVGVKNAESTKRQKLTSFISKELKSRQEFKPPLASFVTCAKAEPLHLKNNTVKEHFLKIFKICTSETNFKNAKSFKDIPTKSLFVKFVNFIHDEMSCNFLSKKIKQWFNESFSGGDRDFTFRFRGKESNSFLRNFQKLILFVFELVEKIQLKQRLIEIHYQCKKLRKLLTLSVRIVNFDQEGVEEMKNVGKQLFKACCLFYQNVTSSLWTLCIAAQHLFMLRHAMKILILVLDVTQWRVGSRSTKRLASTLIILPSKTVGLLYFDMNISTRTWF